MSVGNTAVDFNFSFAPGVTDDQILGFELAGEMWSQHLGDSRMKLQSGKDFTVNIHVKITDSLLPDNEEIFTTIRVVTGKIVREVIIWV